MRDEYKRNRDRLISLINSTPYFSRRDLVAKFYEGHADDDPLLIDPVMTIPDFLEQLREVRVLGEDGGLYYHLTGPLAPSEYTSDRKQVTTSRST
jgi:hypothetical protein